MQIEELIEIIRNNPNAEQDMLAEMQELLQEETEKPEEERNYDSIAALSAAITNALMPRAEQEAVIQSGMKKILNRNSVPKKTNIRRMWIAPLTAACACVILLIGTNAWSLHATGVGILTRTYRFFCNSFSFDFSDTENTVSLDTGEHDDPYGIRTECEKYGFSPLVPQYIPEKFALTVTEHNEKKYQDVYFTFKNGNKLIFVFYRYYLNPNDVQMHGWGLPSDTHNVSELVLNGVTVTVAQEDQQYHAMFLLNNTIVGLHTKGIDYSEADQILRSMF